MKHKTLMPLGMRGVLIAAAVVAIFASMVMFAYADFAPTVTTTIRNSSNTIVTSAPVGSSVQASVLVASSSATTSPTGTVTFNRYANLTCAGTPTSQSGVSLVNGMASSSFFAVPTTSLSYNVFYAGQAGIYSAATSSCVAVTAIPTTTPMASSTISGQVYNDLDKDAVKDAGEAGVAGFTIKLYKGAGWWKNGAEFMSATTDSNGNYSFGSLPNGTYSIELINMHPWKQNSADYHSVVIANQVSQANKDFAVWNKNGTTTPVVGTTTPATISGKVYNDLDGDKKLDSNEPGLAGFTVNLYNHFNANSKKGYKTPFKSITTDSNGNYSFANLSDGKYSVEVINQTGWKQKTGDYHKLKIKKGENLTNINFAHSSSTSSRDDDEHRMQELKKWLQSKGWWGWWNSR